MSKLKAIKAILFPPKVERESKLQLVHTFSNGQTLWTYTEENFLNISSRYYSAIQIEMVHLEILHQTKAQWKSAVELCNNGITDLLLNIDDKKRVVNGLTELKTMFHNFDASLKDIKSSSQRVIEMMFCMFFLLGDEKEFGYNEAKNAEKLRLINDDLVAKELFFSQVQKILEGWLPLSDTTLQNYIVQLNMEAQAHLAMLQSKSTSTKPILSQTK